MAYSPERRRLEIFYRRPSGSQFYPISQEMFQQLARLDRPRDLINEWIKRRRVRWDVVRTERKLLAEMLVRGAACSRADVTTILIVHFYWPLHVCAGS
jgi:hypothetical protein